MRVLAQDSVLNAVAPLQDSQGATVGSVFFTQTGAKVWIVIQANNLPPGFHGLQIYTTGQCGAPGAVFNPVGAAHPNQPGDLSVLLVMQDGTANMSVVTDRFKVADLLDADGSAVIVHANADNYANIPSHYSPVPDSETLATGDAGDSIACGVIASTSSASAIEANLKAVQALPLDNLPAKVSRGENAEHGTLVLTLHALGDAQIQGQITSGAAGQIGDVTKDGDFVVFTFTEITYDIAPMDLPGGLHIGPQTIHLDPSQPSTLRTNIKTGEISRDFHWIQTATDVLYNGQPTLALGDTAKAQIADVQNLGDNRYSIRLLTHWKSAFKLDNWTIAGTTLPGGEFEATAEFDGIYVLDFNK